MPSITSTVGAVLAGGESRRFGSAKALADWRGRPLIEWVLDAHRAAVQEVCIVTNDPQRFDACDVPVVRDVYPGRGPAAGIHAALRWAAACGAEGVWVSPCDAPLVDPALLTALLVHAARAAAVLPRSTGPLGFEPLFGWYATAGEPLFADALERAAIPMHEMVARLGPVIYIDPPEGAVWDFFNVNTRADLAALERARGQSRSG